MDIRADEISQILKEQIKNYDAKVSVAETGTILSVGDGIARIHGLANAMAGELLEFPGGMVGMVLTGVFAAEIGLTSGETETFVKHLVALLGVAVGAFGLSYGLFALVNALIPMRVTEHQEKRGLDDSQHGEKMA